MIDSAPLNGDQRRAVERTRDFLRARLKDRAPSPRTWTWVPWKTPRCYATDGFGAAMSQMRNLLAILDELAPAQTASGTAGGTHDDAA